jgi:hypothetical protein
MTVRLGPSNTMRLPYAEGLRPSAASKMPVGRDHINGIEGFWSYAKNWLYPYRGVPRQYLHLYLAEVCCRYNHRNQDLKPLLSGS